MTVSFLNTGFEEGDETQEQTPSGLFYLPAFWTLTGLSASGSEYATFSFGGVTLAYESFELWTANEFFLFEFESTDLIQATFNTGLFISAVEHFEAEWSGNESYLVNDLPLRELMQFDTTNDDQEDFEEEWSGNENALFEFGPGDLLAASFDTGSPETVEDFEEEWLDNQNHKTSFDPGDLSSAEWDSNPGEPAEDFEEVDDSSHLVLINIGQVGLYTITINGRDHTYTSTSGSFLAIRDALVSLINNGPEPVEAVPAVSSNEMRLRATGLRAGDGPPFYSAGALGPDPGDITIVPTNTALYWTQPGLLII